jgi:hypothetical protein
MNEDKGVNLKERLGRIEQGLLNLSEEEKKKKEKKFRLPFGRKVSKSQAKKNYILIIKINENGNIDFIKKQIDEQTIMEDGVPRLAGSQYIMYYKKMPVIILPSWSVKPFSPIEQYEKSLDDGSNKKGYKILMNKMQKEQTFGNKQISGIIKWIFGLGILGIIAYAFLTGGG